MRKTLLVYVKPHVQEDPVSQVLGITYLAAVLEREGIPIEIIDPCIYPVGLTTPVQTNPPVYKYTGTAPRVDFTLTQYVVEPAVC